MGSIRRWRARRPYLDLLGKGSKMRRFLTVLLTVGLVANRLHGLPSCPRAQLMVHVLVTPW
jgi:hypothetical protein